MPLPPSPDTRTFTAALADPDVERRVRRLVSRALSDYEWIMRWGSTQERTALLRSALPNLLRALNQKDEAARSVQQREAYERLQQAFEANILKRTVDG